MKATDMLPLLGAALDVLVAIMAKNKNAIRHALGKELSLKYLPDLRFKEDLLIKQIEKTDQIFKTIKEG